MTASRKLIRLLICITLCAIALLALASCDDTQTNEDGVIYDGTTVIGCDKDATEINIKDGTLSIASNAFSSAKSLKKITIPKSVTSVSAGAFSGCDAVIEEANGIYYVDNWVIDAKSTLTHASLREGTVGIADEAFRYCNALESAYIGSSVKSIGIRAFLGCGSLSEITLPYVGAGADVTFNTHFGYIFGAPSADTNSNYIPKSLTTVVITNASLIADKAFKGCDSIVNITLSEGIKSIGKEAFKDCVALERINLPDATESIGEYAFEYCSALNEISLPSNDKFTTISKYTFRECISLQKLDIPDSVIYISACAVATCNNLKELTLPQNPDFVGIGQQAFDGCSELESVTISGGTVGKGAFRNCSALSSVSFAAKAEIEDNAFDGCSNLEAVSGSENVTYIGSYSFRACVSLGEFDFSDELREIGTYAFYSCSKLNGISLPDSVIKIGEGAFSGCRLINVTVDNITYVDGWITSALPLVSSPVISADVRGIADGAFDDCSNLEAVYFEGSETEWLSITENSANTQLSKTKIYYNYGSTD